LIVQLFKFKGGVKPATHKTESNATPIRQAPLPTRLAVPLHQSIGGTPHPIVVPGERVKKGQRIGDADGWISAAVHAPTSGTVKAVEMVVQPHASGLASLAVVIEPDGADEWIERQPLAESMAPEALRLALQEAGVVGLGGAVFPSHAKLTGNKSVPMDELVINGAECEPFITCDDRLMRERAEDVLRGVGLFRDLLQPKKVLIGIEDNKPEAIAAMREATQRLGECFEVIAVPTRYPAGGAKQLIRVLTGKEVSAGKRSTDLGVQCFNVATAYSAWRAVAYGEPVLSRLVTLTGNVAQSGNWDVLIGAPIDQVMQLAEPKAGTHGIVMGGPMMGFLLPDASAPVVKATNCLIAHTPALFPPKPAEMPCIRCGECAKACPHELQPFEMYWWSRAKNFGKAQEYKLFDCIECGCCSFVCPSRIPLVQYFRFAKSEIWAREREKKAAEGAKERFEFKTFRDEREKQEKAERLAKAAAAQKAKAEAEATAAAAGGNSAPGEVKEVTGAEAAKKALIAAAMARAKAQREAADAAAATANAASAPIDGAPAAGQAAANNPEKPATAATTDASKPE
jgi:Na+-translocating ferredoxin:NAD+ oxidoreductase subunit C